MKRKIHRRGSITGPWLVLSGLVIAIVALVWGLRALTHPGRGAARGEEIVLLCAAGPQKPVQELCAEYEKQYGVKVCIEADNSGRLLSRLRIAPARADLYLASDESFMREARQEKLVAEVLPVVRQHAVIGVAKGNPKKIHALDDLLKDDLRVVLPNPKLAAIAESVERALAGTGHWQALLDRQRGAAARVSSVGNVTEAAQAVKIGAADASFVWDATARQFGLDPIELPELQSGTQERAVLGVVAASPRAGAALRLARFLTSADPGQKLFAKHYYQPIEGADAWEDRPSLVLKSEAKLKPAIDETIHAFAAREGVDINTIYSDDGGQTAERFFDASFACDDSSTTKVRFAIGKDTRHPYLMQRLLEAMLEPESQDRIRMAGFQWIGERGQP